MATAARNSELDKRLTTSPFFTKNRVEERLELGLLLAAVGTMSVTGVVCCGGKDNTGNAVDTGRVSESETGGLTEDGFGPPSQEVGDEATGSPAVWAFKNLGATIEYSEQDKVSSIFGGDLTDAGLVHLKGLTNLEALFLSGCEKITDAGLVHLKDLTNLEVLGLAANENITDSSVAELQKALPNCVIFQ